MPDPWRPPARYDDARFASYVPQNESQDDALHRARQFVRLVRVRYGRPGWMGLLPRRRTGLRGGIYLVGPVGTGKTHLLAAIHHALTGPVTPGASPARAPSPLRRSSAPETRRGLRRSRRRAGARAVIDEVELDDPANEVRLIGVLRALRERGVTWRRRERRAGRLRLGGARARPARAVHRRGVRAASTTSCPCAGPTSGSDSARDGRAWVGPPRGHARRACAPPSTPRPSRSGGSPSPSCSADDRDGAPTPRGRAGRGDGALHRGRRHRRHRRRAAPAPPDGRPLRPPDAPTLYFSCEAPPADWFRAEAPSAAGSSARSPRSSPARRAA